MARGFKRKAPATGKTDGKAVEAEPSAKIAKAPEAAEVLEIAQTRNLFKSNLFRLQLEELLRELAPLPARPGLEAFLRALQPALLALKPRELPADLAHEFPHLHFHQRQPFPFAFKAPQRVDVVGSFLLGTTCKISRLNVDIAIEMPREAFQSKDYLNFRYLDKRAAYLGEVCRQLTRLSTRAAAASADAESKPLAGMELNFESLQGDVYRPCVAVRMAKPESRDATWVVRLLPTCVADMWVPSRLAPDRNAVRTGGTDGPEASSTAQPTPQYNSCVLEDCRMRAHLEFLHAALQRVPALKDAILLLKQWALAKGFIPGASGVAPFVPLNGFCLSILAAHAAQTSSVSPTQTSSFQLFKLALTVLASTDWATQKVILGTAVAATLSSQERGLCVAHFYDSDGIFNFFWRLGPFMSELQQKAQRDLKVLDVQSDPYEAVFGRCSSPELVWDLIVRTPNLGVAALCPDVSNNDVVIDVLGKQCPVDAPEAMAMGANVAAALTRGLGDRCLRAAIRIVGDPCVRWSEKKPEICTSTLIGCLLDAPQLDRVLDRGPSAQDSESSSQFRAFWGADKAEMRRFKDGSILECVVWSKPPAERCVESRKQPAVVTQIVNHILKKHFPRIAAEVDVVAGPLGFVPNLSDSGRRLWQAFEEFRTCLGQLSSLPLTIRDVHPASKAFTYTDVAACEAPPAADGVQRLLQNVVVEFESSGRWPEQPDAQRKVCTALLLQMRQEFQAELGIESDVAEGFLDVRFPEFVFRVEIFHQHELTETAHRVTNFQVQKVNTPLDIVAVERLRHLWWRPRVVATLHAQVLQKPALAGAVRLCKRWMSSQMLSGYDEFIDHLAMAAFLQPAPFDEPTSPQVGFCRICWLLDTYDWSHEPLIVDFDGKLTEEQRLSMRQSFENRHDADGPMSFWISSRFDPHALLLITPPPTVSAWLQRRARQALIACGKKLQGLGALVGKSASRNDWQQLFALDSSIFDVIIRLSSPTEADLASKRKGGAVAARRRALAMREAAENFIEKIRSHLSSVCMVFFDRDNQIVALKWRPDAFFPQHQHVLMGSIPHTMLPQVGDKAPLCVPNILCLTSLVSSLADGLAVDVKLVGTEQ